MRVLILATTEEEFKFFSRFTNSLIELNWDISFLTQIPSIKLRVDIKNCLISKVNSILINVNKEKLAQFFVKTLSETRFDLVFIWSGNVSISSELREYCKNNQKTLYFELANIPGKLFVDSLGVNTKSSLFLNPFPHKNYDVSEEEYRNWLSEYLKIKRSNKMIPQAKIIGQINPWFIFDFLYYKISFIKPYGEYNILKKLNFYKHHHLVSEKMDLDEIDGKYIFFPLQVSNDTQITQNSKVDNIDAIEIAKSLAESEECDLVTKIHPAETDQNFIDSVLELRKKFNFKITSGNTFELIENSKKVVTINSTVGLECKILGKEVEFLGESFFESMNEEYIKDYILGYLIDINPFGEEIIKRELCEKVINRACN